MPYTYAILSKIFNTISNELTKIDANPQNLHGNWKHTWTRNKMKTENYKMKWKQQMFEWKTMCICVDQFRNFKSVYLWCNIRWTEYTEIVRKQIDNRYFGIEHKYVVCYTSNENICAYALNKVQNPKHKICSAQGMRLIFVLNSFGHKIMKLFCALLWTKDFRNNPRLWMYVGYWCWHVRNVYPC